MGLHPVIRARLTLVLLVLFALLGFSRSTQRATPRLPNAGTGDAILYLTTIERIRAGEGYYQAVGGELRREQYPATSVFNWRTPAHFLTVAGLSVPVATVLLKALAFATILLTPVALAELSLGAIFFGTVVLMGAVATAFSPMAVGVADVWAGVLVALSLCAYSSGRWTAAAAFGVAAVFTREIAAPYGLACGLLALRAGRRHERAVWVAGGLAYVAYFAFHATQVWAHQRPGDLAQAESWIRWNGLTFTLDTVSVNGWLSLVPRWGAVLYMVVALASLASPMAPLYVTGPLLAYLVLFLFAGQPFNYYWGFVTAPIWAFAAAHGVGGLERLVLSARQPVHDTHAAARL